MSGYAVLSNSKIKKLVLFNNHIATFETLDDCLKWASDKHVSDHIKIGGVFFIYGYIPENAQPNHSITWRVIRFNATSWFAKMYSAHFVPVVFSNLHNFHYLARGKKNTVLANPRKEFISPEQKDFGYPYLVVGKPFDKLFVQEGNLSGLHPYEFHKFEQLYTLFKTIS